MNENKKDSIIARQRKHIMSQNRVIKFYEKAFNNHLEMIIKMASTIKKLHKEIRE